MAKQTIPSSSRDLIELLRVRFPDVLDVNETKSPFERGKYAGIVELLRELKYTIDKEI